MTVCRFSQPIEEEMKQQRQQFWPDRESSCVTDRFVWCLCAFQGVLDDECDTVMCGMLSMLVSVLVECMYNVEDDKNQATLVVSTYFDSINILSYSPGLRVAVCLPSMLTISHARMERVERERKQTSSTPTATTTTPIITTQPRPASCE